MVVILEISPLECAGCIQQIEDHLLQLDGVDSVHVFSQVGKVRIKLNQSKTTKEQIGKSMIPLDIPVLSIKNNQENERVRIV